MDENAFLGVDVYKRQVYDGASAGKTRCAMTGRLCRMKIICAFTFMKPFRFPRELSCLPWRYVMSWHCLLYISTAFFCGFHLHPLIRIVSVYRIWKKIPDIFLSQMLQFPYFKHAICAVMRYSHALMQRWHRSLPQRKCCLLYTSYQGNWVGRGEDLIAYKSNYEMLYKITNENPGIYKINEIVVMNKIVSTFYDKNSKYSKKSLQWSIRCV